MSSEKMKALIAREVVPQKLSMWGKAYPEFTPPVCSEFLGDGEQLIWVCSLSQRPYYWLIRIDSQTDAESSKFDIEEIINLLEDEFGRVEEEELRDTENELHNLFPAVYWDGGSWGEVEV